MELAAGALAVGVQNTALGAGEINAAIKIHKEVYMQDKRLFLADYAEGVSHHAEAYAQAQRIHAQEYALSEASYQQGERHHRREFQQTKLQHKIDRDVVMRAEIRSGLRDEFRHKNERYNALMICQTVMLMCAFQLTLYDPPTTMWTPAVWVLSALLGLTFGLLSLSLWYNFIVTRRINQYTPGVINVEMHRYDEQWRKRRGLDDILDIALLRDYFRQWFATNCGWQANASMQCFWTGVITLFLCAGLHFGARCELRNRVEGSIGPFMSVLVVVTSTIYIIEARERATGKAQTGVYSRPWVGELLSSLRDQIGELLRFEDQTGVDGALDEEQELIAAAMAEQHARRLAPSSSAVAEVAEGTEVAAKTEVLLEKAWRYFQENERKERKIKHEDWERDDWLSSILTEVKLLHRGRSQAKTHSKSEHEFVKSLESEVSFDVDDGSTVLGAALDPLTGLLRGRPGMISTVPEERLKRLRKQLGSYFRSVLVHLRNETGVELHLKGHKLDAGTWFEPKKDPCMPPNTIPPYTEVVFASTSRLRWLGSTAAVVVYDTRAQHAGTPWQFELRWSNYITGSTDDKACEASHGREQGKALKFGNKYDHLVDLTGLHASAGNDELVGRQGPDVVVEEDGDADQYFVTKDDDDTEDNSEVWFTVTSAAEQDAASRTLGQAYQGPRKGSAEIMSDSIKAGTLLKRRPDGLGFLWQSRYFVLTASKLCYFKSAKDVRAHALLGQIPLQHIIAAQREGAGNSEFTVIVANSQRPPYHLRAESASRAQEWLDTIQRHAPRLNHGASQLATIAEGTVEIQGGGSVQPAKPQNVEGAADDSADVGDGSSGVDDVAVRLARRERLTRLAQALAARPTDDPQQSPSSSSSSPSTSSPVVPGGAQTEGSARLEGSADEVTKEKSEKPASPTSPRPKLPHRPMRGRPRQAPDEEAAVEEVGSRAQVARSSKEARRVKEERRAEKAAAKTQRAEVRADQAREQAAERQKKERREKLGLSASASDAECELAEAAAASDFAGDQQMAGYVRVLRQVPLFTALSLQQLFGLAANLTTKQFESTTDIITKGEPGDAMYIVGEGEAMAVGEDRKTIYKEYQRGDFFGELSLMDGARRSATVVAVGTTTCLVLSASDFQPVKDQFAEQLQYLFCPWNTPWLPRSWV
jgi:hypothetical protein